MKEISLTADQMLELLEIVARDAPLTIAQLAQKSGMNRTVIYRLMATLHRRGYVVREEKAYILGPRVAALTVCANPPDVVELARPVMQLLSEETSETVVLHQLDNREAVVVAQALSTTHLVRVQHVEGSRHALTLGASGRALLAFQPSGFIKRILTGHPEQSELQDILLTIRQQGFAWSKNELQNGVIGVATPLYISTGQVKFSLALLAPQQREATFSAYQPLLIKRRDEIEILAR